jgi:SAM-dependent methyltransferase
MSCKDPDLSLTGYVPRTTYGMAWKSNARKIEMCKVFAGETILDIGCSVRQAERYCDGAYIGFDIRIVNSERKPDVLGEAQYLPFRGKSFNTILAFDIVEHLADGDLFMSECFRLLKPEGRLLITTPNGPRSPFARADITHISIYTAKRMKALLETHGFTPLSCNVFNIHSRLLEPLKILPRFLGEYLASKLVSEIFIIGTKARTLQCETVMGKLRIE